MSYVEIWMQRILLIQFDSLVNLISHNLLSWINIIMLSFISEFNDLLPRSVNTFCSFLFRVNISYKNVIFMSSFWWLHPYKISNFKTFYCELLCQSCLLRIYSMSVWCHWTLRLSLLIILSKYLRQCRTLLQIKVELIHLYAFFPNLCSNI